MTSVIKDVGALTAGWLQGRLEGQGFLEWGGVTDVVILEQSVSHVSEHYHLKVTYEAGMQAKVDR